MINNTTNSQQNINNTASNFETVNTNNTNLNFDTVKPKKKSSLKMVLGVVVLLFIVLGSGIGFYLTQYTNFDLRQKAWLGEEKVEENAQKIINNGTNFNDFTQRKSNLVVGNVTVSINDLEKRFSIYHASTPENEANQILWTQVAEKLVRDASLQDFASKEGFLSNSPQDFDPKKVNQATTYFEEQGTNHISGEVITLWFYNTNEPDMGVDKARQLQKERIDKLYTQIKSGTLTMKQAGEEIKKMNDVEEIDPAWIGNAYRKFEYINPDEKILQDNNLNTIIWNLQENQISNILVGQDLNGRTKYDAYFSIVKINKKETNKQSGSLKEVVETIEIK